MNNFDENKLKIKFEIGGQIGDVLKVNLIYEENIISSDSVQIKWDDICPEYISFNEYKW